MLPLTPLQALLEIQEALHSRPQDIRFIVEAALERHQATLEIAQHQHEGVIAVVESGRDCDGVEYDGYRRVIAANVEALDALYDEISEWADGPFRLTIVPMETEVKYTSRDLVMEAHENGHPHSIMSSF